MKYNYKQGIVQKDKRGHKGWWLTFFIMFITISYIGLLATTLTLNGWPLDTIDQTARTLKSTKPGAQGDRLFIPSINLTTSLRSKALTVSGEPNKSYTIQGSSFGIGLWPQSLRDASPFFNLADVRAGDEIFVDKADTRYAYKVVTKKPDNYLLLQSGNIKKYAEPIGTVAWRDGVQQIETL